MSSVNSIWDSVNASVAARAFDGDINLDYVQLEQASRLQIVPIRWLWPGWLARGKFHVLAGAPGTGKTTIAMSVAAAVSNGGTFPCGSQAGIGSVLIWTGEDDPADTLAPRLIASGANLANIYFVRGTMRDGEQRSFDPGRDIDLLLHEARKIGNVQLLVVDPIVSAITGDGHKANDVRRGLQPLVDLGLELDCAVLGITHFSKGSSGRDPVERVMGSQAFGALARVVIVAAKESGSDADSPSRRFIALAKSNISPDGGGFDYELHQGELESHQGIVATHVEWRGAIVGSARELLGAVEVEGAEDGMGSERDDAKAFLVSLLSDGPVSVKAIRVDATGAGYAWRTIERAKKDAGIDARKLGLKDGWVWALPND
ncbi:MAG: AAA family ATPase [Polaromonas sp.]|nr:AAA family ATPase [Polaromonas sp.]